MFSGPLKVKILSNPSNHQFQDRVYDLTCAAQEKLSYVWKIGEGLHCQEVSLFCDNNIKHIPFLKKMYASIEIQKISL